MCRKEELLKIMTTSFPLPALLRPAFLLFFLRCCSVAGPTPSEHVAKLLRGGGGGETTPSSAAAFVQSSSSEGANHPPPPKERGGRMTPDDILELWTATAAPNSAPPAHILREMARAQRRAGHRTDHTASPAGPRVLLQESSDKYRRFDFTDPDAQTTAPDIGEEMNLARKGSSRTTVQDVDKAARHREQLLASAEEISRFVATSPRSTSCPLHAIVSDHADVDEDTTTRVCPLPDSRRNNCKVAHFGVGYDFAIDRYFLDQGCDVWSFDPSMRPVPGDYQQGSKHQFFYVGVGNRDVGNRDTGVSMVEADKDRGAGKGVVREREGGPQTREASSYPVGDKIVVWVRARGLVEVFTSSGVVRVLLQPIMEEVFLM